MSPESTTAALLVEPFRVELVERALAPVGEGRVRLRVLECGLCASEVDIWTGRAPEKLPVEIGHEAAGVVEEVGGGVTVLRPGDRVAAWVEGGGFAERLVVEERFCVPVSATAPHPAMAEPLSCVVNAVELAAPALGDDVVIVGAGFMGNLIQLVSALRGPRSIVVADVRADALARARELGATRVVDSAGESLQEAVREVTRGRGADLTYEVTGVQPGLDLCGEVTRMGGKLAIVGYHQGERRSVPLGHWNWMAYQLINAHFRDRATIMAGMRAGMRLLDAGALDPTPLITHTYPLGEIAAAFETATAKPEGFAKAVIEPGA